MNRSCGRLLLSDAIAKAVGVADKKRAVVRIAVVVDADFGGIKLMHIELRAGRVDVAHFNAALPFGIAPIFRKLDNDVVERHPISMTRPAVVALAG